MLVVYVPFVFGTFFCIYFLNLIGLMVVNLLGRYLCVIKSQMVILNDLLGKRIALLEEYRFVCDADLYVPGGQFALRKNKNENHPQ